MHTEWAKEDKRGQGITNTRNGMGTQAALAALIWALSIGSSSVSVTSVPLFHQSRAHLQTRTDDCQTGS